MTSICYVGPCFDYSGYGEANRHFIAALDAAGVDVSVFPVSYVMESADFGKIGALCKKLSEKENDYKIKILHITPDQYPRYIEEGKYNIGHLFWETSKIPAEFVKTCNMMQEIWTGSQTNADAIKRSGVTVPIFVAPQPIETERDEVRAYVLPGCDKDTFVFYSIFEWTERKNPIALIRSYLEEFDKHDNVALLIKSYVDNFNNEQARFLRTQFKAMRARYGSGKAKMFLYRHLMDRSQINRLHETGDCYVTSHRGEGWGIPIVEAMLHANPVITTGYNGVHDYLDSSVAHLLPYTMVGVQNNRNQQWYAADQKWANVDLKSLREAMRKVYNNKIEAREMGERARAFVLKRFNFNTVGKMLADRLSSIERDLS